MACRLGFGFWNLKPGQSQLQATGFGLAWPGLYGLAWLGFWLEAKPCTSLRFGMLGYQKHEAASAYRFGPTSVRRFRDITIAAQARNRCYKLDMVILKVGLLCEPPVLSTSGKIYQLSSFSF
jgi:hypothetical protein